MHRRLTSVVWITSRHVFLAFDWAVVFATTSSDEQRATGVSTTSGMEVCGQYASCFIPYAGWNAHMLQFDRLQASIAPAAAGHSALDSEGVHQRRRRLNIFTQNASEDMSEPYQVDIWHEAHPIHWQLAFVLGFRPEFRRRTRFRQCFALM